MVIQRWQSVYLLVAAILMAFYAFLPIAGFSFGGNSFELSLLGIDYASEQYVEASKPVVVSWPLFVLSLLIAVLSAVTIFKFKNMKLQKTLCWVCIALTVALVISMVILSSSWDNLRYYFSNCMPILSIVALIMAIRGISKDQRTLSSYDRLR